MTRNLMYSLVLAPLLVLAAGAMSAPSAEACGGYGAPTEADRVRSQAFAALHDNYIDRDVRITSVRVNAATQLARVEATLDRAGKPVRSVLVFARVDASWKLLGRFDRPIASTQSSSARLSVVRKTR